MLVRVNVVFFHCCCSTF